MPDRKADARWEGNLKDGKGTMRLGGGAWEGPYSFSSRFEEGAGTNPEELIAAAHAGCFSMAFANILSGAGHEPESVATTAKVTLTKKEEGFRITHVNLTTEASVPGIDDGEFQQLATKAKENCPVSVVLAGAEISVDASLR